MQRVKRFARYWDMIANSGRFKHTLPLILGIKNPNENTSAFKRFMQLSDALHNTEGSTWKIALPRLYKLLYEVVSDELAIPEEQMREYLEKDHQRTKQKGSLELILNARKNNKQGKANKRQMNHAS
jgi:hypothetical protein